MISGVYLHFRFNLAHRKPLIIFAVMHRFLLLILKRKYMKCAICNKDLTCIDYFGRILKHQDGHVEGDIYQCQNEECEGYQEHYHTHRNNPDDLHGGYPC